MDAVFTAKELAARWKCHENTVRVWEDEGKIHRLPGIPNVRYSAKEVYQLEEIGLDAKAMTVWERKQKDDLIKRLQEENKKLRDRLVAVMVAAQGEA